MRLRAAWRVASIRSAGVRSSESAIGSTIPPYRLALFRTQNLIGVWARWTVSKLVVLGDEVGRVENLIWVAVGVGLDVERLWILL
jgi:hypothetical protein